jgi:hypothetical protein
VRDLSFEKGAADGLAARLNAAKAELGRPHDGRWRWWRKRRHSAKVTKVLRETTPATVTRYDGAKQRVTDTSRDARRACRRRVLWLWVRIVFAAIWAMIRRARMAILILAVIAGFSVAAYYYGPSLIRLLSELATVDETEDESEDQVTPSSQASPSPVSPTAPSATPQSPAPIPTVTGANAPAKGPR